MYCANCGQQLIPGQSCPCGFAVQQYATPPALPNTENAKLYSVLAYINLFWLVGMLASPEKNDPKVRFHVGQGLIAYIATIVGTIGITVLYLIATAISTTSMIRGALSDELFIGGTFSGFMWVHIAYFVILGVFMMLSFIWTITGIINAVQGKEKRLFLIGRLAFYK